MILTKTRGLVHIVKLRENSHDARKIRTARTMRLYGAVGR